jgi:rod shape-determining protein MreB
VAPIAETIMDLLLRVDPEYQQRVLNNIVLAGGSSLIAGLSEALEKALAELGIIRVSIIKDPIFAGSDGGLAIARDATDGDWEKLSL